MMPFRYLRAETLADALAAGRAAGARYIAGGTNLLDLMKLGIERPSTLVDISRLPLGEIERTPDGGLEIGAAVTNSKLAADPNVRCSYPLLAQALLAGASAQLRNMASVAGNLLQRTRCAYFYDLAAPGNKRTPGAGCAALDGHNRMHAILGADAACIATHPSDMAVALVALDAQVRIATAGGTVREIQLADLYVRAGADPGVETTLAHGELITHILLPAAPAGHQHYRKVRDRASYAFAMASAAVVIGLDGARIRTVQIALGGVAPRPWRAERAEAALRGAAPTREAFVAAATAGFAVAHPPAGAMNKVQLVQRTIVAALEEVTDLVLGQ